MGWVVKPRPDRFTPGKDPVPIVWEAGWAPGLDGCEKSRPHRDSIHTKWTKGIIVPVAMLLVNC
jgi:hypothetical protein